MPASLEILRPWKRETDRNSNRTLIWGARGRGFVRTGFCIGVAGGLAEIALVWVYATLTGGDAAVVARHVASAIGLDRASAATGVAIHMGLAVVLGVGLSAVLQTVAGRSASHWLVFAFMLCSLTAVWVINFFIVLPAVSPSFIHLLPYAVTLTSKLAFGLASAAAWCALEAPAQRAFGRRGQLRVFTKN